MSAGVIAAHYVASTSYSAEVLADAPIAYWRLGEPSGTTAADASGNSHPGTYVNSPTLGVAGALPHDTDTAATFNGTNQRVTLATGLFSNAQTADYSVECWVKFTTAVTSLMIAGADNGSGARGGALWTLTGGKIQWGSTAVAFVASTSAYNDGNWHHVVGVHKGSTHEFSLNVDKILVAGPTAITQETYNGFTIAARGTAANFFPGTIDEVAYYSTMLSSARISAHFDAA